MSPCSTYSINDLNPTGIAAIQVEANRIQTTPNSDPLPKSAEPFNHQGQLARPTRQIRSSRSMPNGAGSGAHSSVLWDFNGSARSTSTNANLGPRFLFEPASFVEYSNSTGTVINCRPQTVSANNEPVQVANQKLSDLHQRQTESINSRARLIAATPTLVTWRQVERLDRATNINPDAAYEADKDTTSEANVDPEVSASSLRYVRQDGSLVIAPFGPREYRAEIHSATYRCCLSNRFGAICSRPIRSRAGKFRKLVDA